MRAGSGVLFSTVDSQSKRDNQKRRTHSPKPQIISNAYTSETYSQDQNKTLKLEAAGLTAEVGRGWFPAEPVADAARCWLDT